MHLKWLRRRNRLLLRRDNTHHVGQPPKGCPPRCSSNSGPGTRAEKSHYFWKRLEQYMAIMISVRVQVGSIKHDIEIDNSASFLDLKVLLAKKILGITDKEEISKSITFILKGKKPQDISILSKSGVTEGTKVMALCKFPKQGSITKGKEEDAPTFNNIENAGVTFQEKDLKEEKEKSKAQAYGSQMITLSMTEESLILETEISDQDMFIDVQRGKFTFRIVVGDVSQTTLQGLKEFLFKISSLVKSDPKLYDITQVPPLPHPSQQRIVFHGKTIVDPTNKKSDERSLLEIGITRGSKLMLLGNSTYHEQQDANLDLDTLMVEAKALVSRLQGIKQVQQHRGAFGGAQELWVKIDSESKEYSRIFENVELNKKENSEEQKRIIKQYLEDSKKLLEEIRENIKYISTPT